MALKNSDELSDLGRRLYRLMDEYNKNHNEEQKITSPKELAAALYDQNLVRVNSRENFNDAWRDRNNAIQSIEKKIVRHIKSGIVSDQQGDYLLAYSKFFGCSTDFILGLTPVMSSDIEVRRICELLGLSENVVIRLIRSAHEKEDPASGLWSLLMGSDLFYTIPQDVVTMGNELIRMYQNEGEITALQWEWEHVGGKDRLAVGLDIQGQQEQMDSRKAAFYGMLSKMSRNITEFIEQDLQQKIFPFRTRFADQRLRDAKARHGK